MNEKTMDYAIRVDERMAAIKRLLKKKRYLMDDSVILDMVELILDSDDNEEVEA